MPDDDMPSDDPGPVWEHLPGVGEVAPVDGRVVDTAGLGERVRDGVQDDQPTRPGAPGGFTALAHAVLLPVREPRAMLVSLVLVAVLLVPVVPIVNGAQLEFLVAFVPFAIVPLSFVRPAAEQQRLRTAVGYLAMIALLTILVFIVGHSYDEITLSPTGYLLTFITAFIGGALYLGLGQLIVGLVKNPETVSSTTRLVYIAFIMLGMFGELGIFGIQLKTIVHWSPFGTVKTMLAASMDPATWNSDASIALLASVAYGIVFSILGIRWFKWDSR